jgi:hypothetical protein
LTQEGGAGLLLGTGEQFRVAALGRGDAGGWHGYKGAGRSCAVGRGVTGRPGGARARRRIEGRCRGAWPCDLHAQAMQGKGRARRSAASWQDTKASPHQGRLKSDALSVPGG